MIDGLALTSILLNLAVSGILYARDHDRMLLMWAGMLVMNLMGATWPVTYWLADYLGTGFLVLTGAYLGKRQVRWRYWLIGMILYGVIGRYPLAGSLAITMALWASWPEIKHCSKFLGALTVLYAVMWVIGPRWIGDSTYTFAVLRVLQIALLLMVYFERAERHYRALANSPFQGFLIISHNTITFQNQQAAEMVGNLIGRDIHDLCQLTGLEYATGTYETQINGHWVRLCAARSNGDIYVTLIDITAEKQLLSQYQRTIDLVIEKL